MKLLKEKPQKDGTVTKYKCGYVVHGGWRTRLKFHKEYINTEIGMYIINLEQQNKELLIRFCESIKDYEHESGHSINNDERDSKVFVEIFLKNNK